MKLAAALAALFTLTATLSMAGDPREPVSDKDKINYAIGVEMARNFRNQGVEVDPDLVLRGLQDGLSGKVLFPDKELRRIMISFQTEIRRKRAMGNRLPTTDRQPDLAR